MLHRWKIMASNFLVEEIILPSNIEMKLIFYNMKGKHFYPYPCFTLNY